MKRLIQNIVNSAAITMLVAVIGISSELRAQTTYNYRSTTDGNWEDASIWTSNFGNTGTPTETGHSVGIYNSVTLNEGTTVSVKRMDISDDGALTIDGTLTIASGAFGLLKDVVINGSGSLFINNVVNGNNHTLTTNVNVTANGGSDYSNLRLVVNNGTFTNNRNDKTINYITINPNGTFIANQNTKATHCYMNGGTLTIADGKTFTVYDGNGNLHVYDDATIDGNGTLSLNKIQVDEGKTLTIGGNITINHNVTIDGNVVISDGKTLTISGDNRNVTFTGNTNFAGNVSITGNTTIKSMTNCIGGTFTFASGKTITYEASCTRILPGTYQNLTLNTDNVTLCGETQVNGTLAINKASTTIDFNGNNLTQNGTFTLDKKELTIGNGTLTINSGKTFSSNQNLIINENMTFAGNGTINISNNKYLQVNDGKTLTIDGNLTLNNTTILKGHIVVAADKTLTISTNNINFEGNPNFEGSAGDIYISNTDAKIKNLTNCTGGYFTFNESGSVTYENTSSYMLPGNYHNMVLNTSAGNNITLCGNVQVDNTINWTKASRIVLDGHIFAICNLPTGNTTYSSNHMFVLGGDGTLKFFNPTAATITTSVILNTGTYSESTGYEYTPVTIASGVSAPQNSYLTLQIIDTALSGKSTDLARYYTIGTNGITASDATINLSYVDADDEMDWVDNWDVYQDTEVKARAATTIAGYVITVTGLSSIDGVWTAKEPEVNTLYSHSSGNWNEASTWTTDPTGKTQVNQAVPEESDDVVILNGHYITANGDAMNARAVKISSGATLDMENIAESHNFKSVYGQGLLRIEGDFPTKGSYKQFVSADGGTTEFYGTHADNAIPFQYVYNNLVLNYETNVTRTITENLKINGSLTLTKGSLTYTKTNQSIYVGGNLYISADSRIRAYYDGSSWANTNNADTLIVGGNLTNYGHLRMTYRTISSYTGSSEPGSDEGSKGRGVIRMIGAHNSTFYCYNETNLSQLIIDKGTDQTYKVTLYSSAEANFGLLGRADVSGPGGTETPDNPIVIYKPLWLRNGTLELTGNLHILSLSEGGADNFCIPLNGCLHLNGNNVVVDASQRTNGTGNTCFMPAGKLIIDAGTFDCKRSAGAVFRNTSEIIVNGGTLRGSQLRPSQYVDGGKTTFIQTGGEVIFDGQGEMRSGYATFHMPFDSYTFKMTGGTLTIKSAQNNSGGAMVVNCNPENSKITGGEIIIINKAAENNNDKTYGITCSIPLYNLTLENPDNLTSNLNNYHYKFTNYSGIVNTTSVSVEMSKIQILNNLTIGDNVTFNANARDIEIGGNLTIASTAKVYLNSNEVKMNGNGSSMQQLTADGSIYQGGAGSTVGFYKFTIDENAYVQINNNILVNNLFALGNGAIMRDGGVNTYTLKGNATINGTHYKPVSGAGKVLISGTNPTITGNGNGSLNNVDVQLASGELNIDAKNLTITGDLRLLGSTSYIALASSKLTFGSEANIYTDDATSTAYGETKMIYTNGLPSDGGVAKVYSSTAKEFLFPFGTKSGSTYYYTPAKIKYTTADTYGTVTSRPVSGSHPLIGNSSSALGYYWVTDEDDFSGVSAGDIAQSYYYNYDAYVAGDVSNYVPARYHNASWEKLTTAGMHLAAKYMDYNSAESANGHYTCGDPSTSFADILKLYSSSYVTSNGNTGYWTDPRSWSTDSVNGVPNATVGGIYYVYDNDEGKYRQYDTENDDFVAGGAELEIDNASLPLPTASTAVYIGSALHNHTIVMTQNGESCANLRIEPGSTLDLSTYTGHTFALVDVDENAEEGAGTLKISSTAATASFPSGDFTKFLGENGGTVHYYGNHKDYYIPSTSESGLALTNYCNLIVGGTAYSYRIRIPLDIDVTIYKDLAVDGWMHTAYTNKGSHTITIFGNFNVNANSNVYMREAGYNKAQNYIIYGNLNVEKTGKFYVSGTSNVMHNLKIAGSIIANGVLDLTDNDFRITTTFFGTDTSYIKGEGSIEFYTLICDKGTDASPMLILENPNITSAHDDNEPFLSLLHGTFQIDFPNETDELELNRDCNLTIATPTALSVKNGIVNVCNSASEQNLYLNGAIDVQGGTLNIGNPDNDQSNSIIYSATSTPTITVSGGQMNVNGIVRRTTGTRYGTLTYRQSGGEVTIYGKQRNTITAPDGNSVFEILNDGSEFTTSGGKIITMVGGGNETFGDILILPTTTSCTGGEIVIDGSSEQKILSSAHLHKITIKDGSQLDVYSNPITAYDIVIEDNACFNSRGFDLTVKHGLYNYNSSDGEGIAEGGLLSGSINQTTYFTSSNMEFGGANGNLTNFANVIVNGKLKLLGDTSNIMVNKNLLLGAGKVTDNGSTIYLKGNLENYGTFESNTATGGIDFCGTADEQYVIGIGTGELGSVTINNPKKVFLYTDTKINNKLTLNDILYADIYLLTLGENATVNGSFSNNSMILLNGAQEDKGIKKIIPAGSSSFTFPIGIDGYYTPAQYVFTKNTSSAETSITVKTVNYLNKNLSITPECHLNYFWSVTTEGFNEEDDEESEVNPYFSVTQTYTYPDDETHFTTSEYDGDTSTEAEMLPQYLRTLGDYKWLNLTGDASVDATNNTITFNPFGHIEGEYTAGMAHGTIYTALPVLYSKTDGIWRYNTTWQVKNESGDYEDYTGTVTENPVHIRAGHTITVDQNETKPYCLYFDDVTSTLNLGQTEGNDFGRVYGTGKLILEATSKHDFMYPAGNWEKFLNYSTSMVEFGGSEYGTLPASPGNASRPLPSVILSGTGVKKLPSQTAEVINGYLSIANGTRLDNTANNTKIILRGDWIDYNTSTSGFVPGTSIVELNGDSTQRVNIYNNLTTFEQLLINNVGTSSDSIIIGNCDMDAEDQVGYGLKVRTTLTLTRGYVYTNIAHCLDLAEPTTNISGGSANSFVDGPLGKNLNANGNFNYEIGNALRYARTYIKDVSAAGIWRVEYHNADPDDDGYSTDDEHIIAPITNVSDNEYWTIYPPTAAATANMQLRYDSESFPQVNTTAKLKKLTLVGYPTDSKWDIVKNGGAIGSVTSGTITSTEAQAVNGKHYTFGYLGTTAKIDTGDDDKYLAYVCDGSNTVKIPVKLTGTPNWTLQYRIDDGAVKTISGITSESYELELSATNLGGYKDDGSGNPEPYVISLVSVTDPSGSGIVTSHTAEVTVWYNAVPVIAGDENVGQFDTRSYSTGTNATWDKTFLWTWSGTGAGKVNFSNTAGKKKDTATPDISFYSTNSSTATTAGTYRLTVTKTYRTTDGSETCTASSYKTITVHVNPQPNIIADNGVFASCYGETHTYTTTYVSGHTYLWNVTGGSVISGAGTNSITVTWGSSGTGSISVRETNPSTGNYGDDSQTMYFYPAASIGTIDAPSGVCYNTRGTVIIQSTNSSLQYMVYNADNEDVVYSSWQSGNDSDLSIDMSAITAATNIQVKAKNDGCSATSATHNISVLDNPEVAIGEFADLYIGKPADVNCTQTTSFAGLNYSFTNISGSSNIAATNIANPTAAFPVSISVADNATKLKGTLRFTETTHNCYTDYDIDETVSQDYLWKGEESKVWDTDNNWWIGSKPTAEKNVRIIAGVANMPEISADANANNIVIGTGASVTVKSNTLTIKGNLDNSGTFTAEAGNVTFTSGNHEVSGVSTFANLTNNGTVNFGSANNVKGNITNNGTINGTIALNGSAAQSISGEGDYQNLTVNNEEGVSTTGNVTINGALNLSNGVITVGSGKEIVLEPAANATSANVKSYVDGTMRKYGSSPFTFPTGSGGHRAFLGVTPKDADADTYFTVSYSAVANPEANEKDKVEGLERVSVMEYWDIYGTADSQLKLYWENGEASGITDIDKLCAAHYNSSTDKWEMVKVDSKSGDENSGWILTKAVTSYSPYTFGSTDPEVNLLPVSLISFNGRAGVNSVVLNWKTMSEQNNDYFEVERSTDGYHFVTIGIVDGNGTTTLEHSYQFTDNNPECGKLYYRLRQTDFDGTCVIAGQLVCVTFGDNNSDYTMSITPNPTDGRITVSLSRGFAGGKIMILSQSGKLLREFEINSSLLIIDISDLPDGIYLMRCQSDDSVRTEKVVKY